MDFLENPVECARLLGLLVPLLVAALAKWNASSRLKSFVNIVLSALAGVTATLVGADGNWDWDAFFNSWFNAFVLGIVAYYGAYKPTGIAPVIAIKTRNFGLGGQRAA